MISNEINIGVIIILYGTKKINIKSGTLPSNSLLIIVDNTPNQNLKIESTQHLKYISIGENLGIAEAQNRGIQAACNAGCTHVVFFDQDSIVPKGFIEKMVNEYERISHRLTNLFLLGPTVYNGREGSEYKSAIHADISTDFDFIPRREIISSGSCVSMDKINQVGILDSRLFIDYVDFEWCWRGNSKGLQSGITPHATLTHFVGLQEYHFFGQLIIISAPIRYFYQTRNFLWLIRSNYVPTSWKINNGIKRILFYPTYPFIVKQWREIYRNIWRGVIAGVKYYKR